ncbi:MAG: bifunctional riboflavin kinase/FAD synthetase [Succinivibrio sp.]|nr:bifunctional riboflavin kinase/FAD synthetase [Succinivibrio sp.]
MLFFHALHTLPVMQDDLVLAIGNFDGFHLGHQAVIKRVLEYARLYQLTPAVMIFEPQPQELFAKVAPPRIYTLRDKLRFLQSAGMAKVFAMHFNQGFAALTPEQYVTELLHQKLRVKKIIVGSLFNFGRGGRANIADLKRLAAQLDITAEAIDDVRLDGERVSSTLIRRYLSAGQFAEVRRCLGRDYTISGRVVHGNELGRTLNMPTANINLHRKNFALHGVYAVKVNTPSGLYRGVANVGVRPTLGSLAQQSLLEVNLFDFSGDLYGQNLEVTFVKKIRDEFKFAGLEQLKAQLAEDERAARLIS